MNYDTPLIQAENLTRIFHFTEKDEGLKGSFKALFKKVKKHKTAVSSLDLTVSQGELIGLIGPNGAGKTTTIKMMTGIIPPSSGNLTVAGYKPNDLKDDFRKSYAVVMGQKSQLWWDLPSVDTFKLNKEIYGVSDEQYNETIDYLTELFEVKDLLNKQVRKLSLGQRMKMEIIAALLHNPSIIFLDEPTIGLDAVAQKQIRHFLQKLNREKNVTIILTSHYMEDIKHLCDRVVVINHGEKIFDGNYDNLITTVSGHKVITVTFEEETDLNHLDDVEFVEQNPYKVIMKVSKDRIKSLVSALFSQYEIEDISIEEEDITEVVERIYKMKSNGASDSSEESSKNSMEHKKEADELG